MRIEFWLFSGANLAEMMDVDNLWLAMGIEGPIDKFKGLVSLTKTPSLFQAGW